MSEPVNEPNYPCIAEESPAEALKHREINLKYWDGHLRKCRAEHNVIIAELTLAERRLSLLRCEEHEKAEQVLEIQATRDSVAEGVDEARLWVAEEKVI